MSKDFDLKAMRELWQQQATSHLYSQKEILEMLKRKSMTSVKWIFYISLIEIILGVLLYVYSFWNTGLDQYHLSLLNQLGRGAYFYEALSILGLIINFYFIYLFFLNYKKVDTESSVKEFTASIISFKLGVNRFIYFNLSIALALVLLVFGVLMMNQNFDIQSRETIILIAAFIISIIVILGVVWLYYYLLYGTFIRRLKKNLQALSEIEQ